MALSWLLIKRSDTRYLVIENPIVDDDRLWATAPARTYAEAVRQMIRSYARAEMAGELLESTDAPMAEIAHQLGYEYQGDFTRAWRRWSGVSPSEFRRQRRYRLPEIAAGHAGTFTRGDPQDIGIFTDD